MALSLPDGSTLTTLSWSIAGPGGYTLTSASPGQTPVTIGNARAVRFIVGGIPAGTGYSIALQGTDSNGAACTGGSADFSIVPGQSPAPR